jgi:hypothetical protein
METVNLNFQGHYEQTQVDPKTGALNIKKDEAWINT